MSTLQELKDALHAARATAPVPVQQVQQKQQESIEPVDITTATETPAPAQVQNNATAQVEQAKKVEQFANAAPVQTTTVTPVPQEESVPTWQDIVKELTAMDDANEERKAEIKKKQRVATAIAALGDIATHAINVWGATNGYNAPIKGAPLTEAVTKQQQLNLAENDARLEKLKKLKLDAYKGRRSDLADQIKLADYYRRERESLEKSKLNDLLAEKRRLEMQWREAKTEQEREMFLKSMEMTDAKIENLEDLMNKRGTSSSKRTYTVDGVTYDNLAEAYIALPEEYQIEIKHDLQGRPIKPTKFEIEEAIAKYNRQTKKEESKSGVKRNAQGKKVV